MDINATVIFSSAILDKANYKERILPTYTKIAISEPYPKADDIEIKEYVKEKLIEKYDIIFSINDFEIAYLDSIIEQISFNEYAKETFPVLNDNI